MLADEMGRLREICFAGGDWALPEKQNACRKERQAFGRFVKVGALYAATTASFGSRRT